MVYIAKKDGGVVHHTSLKALKAMDGIDKPDMQVSDEEFEAAGGLVRLINGKIVVGKTKAEKEEAEKQEKIAEYMGELEEIDRESGASRQVRDVSGSAGVVLDAVRVIIARFAKELNIQPPAGFGEGCENAADILALAPPVGASEKEIEDFNVLKSLLLLSHFDPSINPGLNEFAKAEFVATPIRQALAPLLKGNSE